jgi:hypothetical protein
MDISNKSTGDAQTQKRAFRFSLRHALMLMTIVAIAAAWLGKMGSELAVISVVTIVPTLVFELVIRFCPRVAMGVLLTATCLLLLAAIHFWGPTRTDRQWCGSAILGIVLCLITAAMIHDRSRRG